MVCVVHSGIDQTGRVGPGTTVAGPGPAAQDVPQTGHKVGADGNEDRELDQSQQQSSSVEKKTALDH